MPKGSVAAWLIPGSIARLANKLLIVAAVAAAAGRSCGAGAAEPVTLEPHADFDRLAIEASTAQPLIPLVRLADGRYRLILPGPVKGAVASPRGLSRFAVDKAADGSMRVLELTPAPGAFLRYLAAERGFFLDIVHGAGGVGEMAAIAPAAAPAGPLPPKLITMGLLFSAPRLAAFRIGDELILVVPAASDLDPSGIPPTRVIAVAVSEQGRYRIVRVRLRPDTIVEFGREGDRLWRMGFGGVATAAPPNVRFAAGGRSAVFGAADVDPEIATLALSEFGTLAVLLSGRNWAAGPARSPYLEVLGAIVGAVILPRTDGITIERGPDGLMVSGTDRRIGG